MPSRRADPGAAQGLYARDLSKFVGRTRQTFTALTAQFEMGRTHLDLAALAQAQGNLAVAATPLHTAHGLFEVLQVPRYVERTAQLARALGGASEVIPTP